MDTESLNEWSLPAVVQVHQRARRALELMNGLDSVLLELQAAEAFLLASPGHEPLVLLSTRVLIGCVLARQEKYAESRAALEGVLPAVPESERALRFAGFNAYALALTHLGESGEAFCILDRIGHLPGGDCCLEERVRVFTHKANILYQSGDHRAALQLRQKAVELSRLVPNPGLRARALINMGCEQIAVNDPAAAERSLQEADFELLAAADAVTRARGLMLQGSVELNRARHRSALKAFLAGLALIESKGPGVILARLKLYAASAHNNLGEFTQAQPLAAGAEAFFESAGYPGPALESILEQARSAFGRKDFAGARERAGKVRKQAEEHGLIELACAGSRLQADIAEARGDLAEALSCLREAERQREATFEKKNVQQIQLLRARHESRKLDTAEETARERAKNLSDLNEALREKNAELERLHHEKRELLTIIAHDLRNQLGATVNYTEMALLAPDSDTEELRGQLQTIYSITHSTQELLEHLLSLERLESGHVPVVSRPLDVASWTRDLIDWAGNLGRLKKIRSVVEMPDEEVTLVTDHTWLRLAVENLLTNALKYSPAGSTVRIRICNLRPGVRIEVVDEGPGIPGEDRANLFTKFHRTRNQPTGSEFSTGLGLYLVRKYAELLGCHAGFRPRDPCGSIFYLEFVGAD